MSKSQNASARKPRSKMSHAAGVTLLFVAATLGVLGLLWWLTHREGPDKSDDFVGTAAFQAWIAIAAISVVAFCDSIVAGVRALPGRPELHAVDGGPIARVRARFVDVPRRLRAVAGATWPYLLAYLAFAILVVVMLLVVGKGGPDVAVQGWGPIARGLLILGALAACPWVVLVWTMHDEMIRTREHIATLSSLTPTPTEPAPTVNALDEQLRPLIADRRRIYTAVGRLTVLVLAAMLMSGALRAALLEWHPSSDVLPASAVLLYGGFFAGVLALVVVPLLRAWRHTAMLFVDQVFPPSVATTADADAARARLVTLLDLNGSLFRSPVALGSVLAPVVTSLVAVLIPKV